MHPRAVWTLAIAALIACGPVKAPLDVNDAGSSHDTSIAETTAPTASTTTLPEHTTGAILGSDGGTTPSTTTDGASTSTSTTGGATSIVGPDGGPEAPFCDRLLQDCSEGQKCTVYASHGGSSLDATKCVPVADNPKHPGEVCTVEGNAFSGIDDCDAKSYCWDTDFQGMGTCAAVCKGTPEALFCEEPGKFCTYLTDGVLLLCMDGCDPLTQDCDSSEVCIGSPEGQGFLCVLDGSGDDGQQHDACEFTNSCDPGLFCANTTSSGECDQNAGGCCQPFCDLDDPNADANCGGAGQACLPAFERSPPEYANVGYCTLPG